MKLNCIFCQIAVNKIPSYKVFEDDNFLAFLNIMPVVSGHALVIPKKHYRWVHQVKEFGPLWEVAQIVAQKQINSLGAPTVLFMTAGFQVPHAHIHVLPAPQKSAGEFLPGIESAKRLKVTPAQLQKTAASLRSGL